MKTEKENNKKVEVERLVTYFASVWKIMNDKNLID
jgi:hypothetical protein